MIFLEAVFLTSVLPLQSCCSCGLDDVFWDVAHHEEQASWVKQVTKLQNIALADVKLATLIIHGHCWNLKLPEPLTSTEKLKKVAKVFVSKPQWHLLRTTIGQLFPCFCWKEVSIQAIRFVLTKISWLQCVQASFESIKLLRTTIDFKFFLLFNCGKKYFKSKC